MGRRKEDLVDVAFRLSAADRQELGRLVITAGFSITRHTKQGEIVLPDWRKWAEAIAKKKILMYAIVEEDG